MTKISVIIPTYNRAKLVRESIDSVLRQTFTDIDIIVVDDGSTDNTKEVVYGFQSDNIRYFYQRNSGVSAARNTGIKAATSEFIAFLDSDDIYLETTIEKALNSFDLHPRIGFSYSQAFISRVGGEIYRTRKSIFHDTSTVIEPLPQLRELMLLCPITLSSLAVRKACFDEVGLFNEELFAAEDLHMFVRLAKRFPAYYIAEPLIIQRYHPDSLRHTTKPGRDKAFPLVLHEIFDDPLVAPHFSDIKRKIYSNYYGDWMMNGNWGTNMKLARKYLRTAIQFYPQIIFSRHGLYIMYKYLVSYLPGGIRIGLRDFKRHFRYTEEEQEANNPL